MIGGCRTSCTSVHAPTATWALPQGLLHHKLHVFLLQLKLQGGLRSNRADTCQAAGAAGGLECCCGGREASWGSVLSKIVGPDSARTQVILHLTGGLTYLTFVYVDLR